MTDNVQVRGRARLATPRSRGGITGLGLLLLGAWGAVAPFVGPYFDYAFAPNETWKWTAARGVMQVAPGAVAFVAGLILLASGNRLTATFAGWLGVAAGAWFVVSPLLTPLYDTKYLRLGATVGSKDDAFFEQLGMFFGLGAVIILLAALAVGRFSVVGVRDVAHREQRVRERRREVDETSSFFGDRPAAQDTEPVRERTVPRSRRASAGPDGDPVAGDTAADETTALPVTEGGGTRGLRRARRRAPKDDL